jgi:hypothetical protein
MDLNRSVNIVDLNRPQADNAPPVSGAETSVLRYHDFLIWNGRLFWW